MKINLTGATFDNVDDSAFAVWTEKADGEGTVLSVDIPESLILELVNYAIPALKSMDANGYTRIALTRDIPYEWGKDIVGTFIDHGKERDPFGEEEFYENYLCRVDIDPVNVRFQFEPMCMGDCAQIWYITSELMEHPAFAAAFRGLKRKWKSDEQP